MFLSDYFFTGMGRTWVVLGAKLGRTWVEVGYYWVKFFFPFFCLDLIFFYANFATEKSKKMKESASIVNNSVSYMTYEYAGICLCGLEHFSRGYSTLSDAHDDILIRCIAGVLSTGVMHSFSVTQCVRNRDEYVVVYQGKVQKTKVEYTIYNRINQKKVNNPKTELVMNIKDFFSDSEIKFLSLSSQEVMNIASVCAATVTNTYDYHDIDNDRHVSDAVKNAIGDLVKVSVVNKVGIKRDGYVCLQDWNLFGKTHCPQFLHLPTGSKAYNRINGTIKIGNLAKKIIEVHTLGNRQLREIQGASIMDQVSNHMTQSPSEATPVTVTQPVNTSATTVVLPSEERDDAIAYVDRLVLLITAYIRNNDVERGLLSIMDICSLVKLKSKKLFTATINDREITINALSTNSNKTITLDASEDTVYDELYCAISELLIEMSLVKHDVVSSIVKVETLADLLQTLLQKNSLGSKRVSLAVNTSEENQVFKESDYMAEPYSNTLRIPHIHWG